MTPWMDWLKENLGQKEIVGPLDNEWIMNLYKFGNYQAKHDEDPWCACLANAALEQTGFAGTGRADAISFKNCGNPCVLTYGAIVLLRTHEGSYHVTFFNRWVDKEKILAECIGGNQANALRASTFNLSGNARGHGEIIAVRWPRQKENDLMT